MLKIVLINPPISNLNTPYAAIPRLTGWLRSLGHQVQQLDLSIELFLRIFSRSGLERAFDAVDPGGIVGDFEDVYFFRDRYIRIIDDVIAFLQGRDPSMAHRIVRGDLLPEGPVFRSEPLHVRQSAYGPFGKIDLARHLATLMLQELAELFRETISPHFMLQNYGEKLLESRPSFDALADELSRPPNVFESMIREVAEEHVPEQVDLVGFTCPFPGNLLGSLMLGKWFSEHRPNARRALGGGYPSTELRHVEDPRVFDYIDYMVLDDGEIPLQQICARIEGQTDAPLVRTFVRERERVVWHDGSGCRTPRFRDLPTPDYRGATMDRYVHLILTRNPITRILNEGLWLKLTAAHGCYWKKCTFCDIHLSYIGDFDPLSARQVADQMDEMHEQTGLSSFHFTDEAAPPPLLVNLALELLRRDRSYQFWGNIRFDPGFTADRCRVLAAAGMIAVTGGIEIANEQVLQKIDKGITIPQVTKVLQAFSDAGILTHAYLIYGFPGETVQDTINSLEILRQQVAAGILNSGFFHRFGATAHSPVGRNPELFGVRVTGPEFRGFAKYLLNIKYNDPDLFYEEWVFQGLQDALHHYASGQFLDRDVREWFRQGELPAPTIPPDYIADTLNTPSTYNKRQDRLCWLGGTPRWQRGFLTVSCEDGELYSSKAPEWLAENLRRCQPANWSDSRPPRSGDFERKDWYESFRDRGVAII